MKRLAFVLLAAIALAACQDTTQPESDSLTSLARLSSFQAHASGIRDIVVNTTSDVADFGGAQHVGDLPGPDGFVSLREAIIAANKTNGPQVIGFNIPTDDNGFDGSVFRILPTSQLPELTDAETTIDGSTQAEYEGDTNPIGPEVVLDGRGRIFSGLSLVSDGNVIRDLVIINSTMEALGVYGIGNRVTGCFIGVSPDGETAQSNGAIAIFMGPGSGNIIGGTFEGAGNLISGNRGVGVFIYYDTHSNVVQGNLIGTDITGTQPVPNGEDGIEIAGSTDNLIGGMTLGAGNIIAFNAQRGVDVVTAWAGDDRAVPIRNTISRNAIFSNDEGLGIDLDDQMNGGGPTENDPGDTDTGPNNLMNFPVLTFALATRGQLVVRGTIDTPNPQTVTIEFFANAVPTPGGDPSSHGEGAVFLGTVKPNPWGTFTATLPAVAPGTLISATATDADGNTSEFAVNIEAVAPGR